MTDLPHVAIIGAGFSGTLLFHHLVASGKPFRISLFEKRDNLSEGTAYSTPYLHHLLNVPAKGMSAFPEDEHALDFVSWLEVNKEHYGIKASGAKLEDTFAPRVAYAGYLRSILVKTIRNLQQTEFEDIAEEVVDVVAKGHQYEIITENNKRVVDKVVFALGNFANGYHFSKHIDNAAMPHILQPWQWEQLEKIKPSDDVFIVGSGLTMVDMVLSLHAIGYEKPIQVLSRHGLMPLAHPEPLQHKIPPCTDIDSLRSVFRALKHQLRQGEHSWYQLIDSLRPITQSLWQHFSDREKQQFLRHLRSIWDVHRHRIAPVVARLLDSKCKAGGLQVHAGSIQAITKTADNCEISFVKRGDMSGQAQRVNANVIINCTGPSKINAKMDNCLIANLCARDWLQTDGLGLRVTDNFRLVSGDGEPHSNCYSLGPLLKGQLFETIAVPDIRVQCKALADELIR